MNDRDFSMYKSIVVVTVLREPPEASILAVGGISYHETPTTVKAHTMILDLRDQHEPYLDCVMSGMKTCQSPEFFLQKNDNEIYYLVDQSESFSDFYTQIPGDMDINTMPLEMTTGRLDEESMVSMVPYRDVVAKLVDCYQSGNIQLAGDLPLTETLGGILPDVRVKTADEVGTLALAVGLVVWAASKGEYESGAGAEYEAGGDLSDWGLPE